MIPTADAQPRSELRAVEGADAGCSEASLGLRLAAEAVGMGRERVIYK
jgi:hypothetical protein